MLHKICEIENKKKNRFEALELDMSAEEKTASKDPYSLTIYDIIRMIKEYGVDKFMTAMNKQLLDVSHEKNDIKGIMELNSWVYRRYSELRSSSSSSSSFSSSSSISSSSSSMSSSGSFAAQVRRLLNRR